MNKKKWGCIVLLALLFAFAAMYIGAQKTESGEMYILNKKQTPAGSYVLTVAKDGAGAVYDLSCTSAQYQAVEACEMITCRWTLNQITHSGRIDEIYELDSVGASRGVAAE